MSKSRLALIGLLTLGGVSGCATNPFKHTPRGPRGHAFIAYWAPPPGSKRLRLAVKDIIDIKGTVTSAGSGYLAKTSPPAPADAACLAIARERGVAFVGKTNLSEFAVAPSGLNGYFGTPVNPFGHSRIPGGSSSGSAVAVANDSADVALGTDTTGSVRLPAACCGVVGLKTTRGLISLKGVYPIDAVHLDTVGPLAKDIARTATGMDLLERGFEGRYAEAMAAKPSGRSITVGRLYLTGTSSEMDRAIDSALAKAGFHVIPLDNNFRDAWNQAAKDAATIAAVGAWINDRKFSNSPDVSIRTKAVVAVGALQYGKSYDQALERMTAWRHAVHAALRDVDFIALPTIQTAPPPKIPLFGGTPLFEASVLSEQNTAPANLSGNPALAIPVPLPGRHYKASLELVGRRFAEADLLNAGRIVEAAVGPQPQKPPSPPHS